MRRFLFVIPVLFFASLAYADSQGIQTLDQWKSDGTNITQRTANKPIKLTGLTPGGCVQLTSGNIATTTGSPCAGGSAASSTLLTDNNTFSGVDLFSNASSNFSGTWQTFSPSRFSLASQITNASSTEPLMAKYYVATSTLVASQFPLASSTAISATTFFGALVGNASTATALSANGTNCSAGNYPLGVDASGNVESCTAAFTGTVTSVATNNGITGGTITTTGTLSLDTTYGAVWTPASTTYTQHLSLNNASSSIFTTGAFWDTNVTSALASFDANHKESGYAGTSCTNQFVRSLNGAGAATCATVANTDLANSTISGVALGSNLAAHTTNSTLSGTSYNGSAAVSDWGINLANANTWSAGQIFAASSTAGNGTQAGGLTTSGGATTTGRAYFGTSASASSTFNVQIDGGLYLTNSGPYSVIGTPTISSSLFNSGVLPNNDNLWIATTTKDANNNHRGMVLVMDYEGPGTSGAVRGLNSGVAAGPNVTGNLTSVAAAGLGAGRYFTLNQAPGYNVAWQTAVSGICSISGTLSSTTDCAAINAELPTVSSGDLLTNYYGFRTRGGAVTGTLTNFYGHYCDPSLPDTNPFCFYQAGTENNYLGGKLGIGTTTPTGKLHISAGANATTTVSIGEIGLSTSKACVNIQTSAGTAGYFYLNSSGAIVSGLGSCTP